MTPKCSAITAKGVPCAFPGSYDGVCLSHAAQAGNSDAREVLRVRGVAGKNKARANAEGRKLVSCSLRTTGEQLAVLERQVIRVENSGADACAKAGAIVKLVSEARATLKAGELEGENADLRAILIEKHPELKKHLKAVS
jgi:hypothetical protein